MEVLQDGRKTVHTVSGSYVRGKVVTWGADGRVFVSVSTSRSTPKGIETKGIAVRTYEGKWDVPGNRRCLTRYLLAEDFERGKQLAQADREYIFRRQKNYETYTESVPRNEVAHDIVQISNKTKEQTMVCVLKRKKLDELDAERDKLEQDLMSQEAKLVELHKDHVDEVEVCAPVLTDLLPDLPGGELQL